MIPLLTFVIVLLGLFCCWLWADIKAVSEDRDRMRQAVEHRDRRIVELIRGEEIDDEHAMGGYDMPPLRVVSERRSR